METSLICRYSAADERKQTGVLSTTFAYFFPLLRCIVENSEFSEELRLKAMKIMLGHAEIRSPQGADDELQEVM